MSAYTQKKAQRLIDTERIVAIDDTTYQIKATKEGESYIIDTTSMVCTCKGYIIRKECSHILAVEKLEALKTSKGETS